MTRAERNEKLHQEAIARQLGRRYGKLSNTKPKQASERKLIEAAHILAADLEIILQE